MLKLSWKNIAEARYALGALALMGWIWPASGAAADDVGSPPPAVSLDQLLKLPSSLEVETSERGGATRAEWHARFTTAEAEVVKAREGLDQAIADIGELAERKGNWKMASPLAGSPGADTGDATNAPLNYGMKQAVNRSRAEVERTERELLELRIEANLAGVPEEWYKPQVEIDETTPIPF